MAAELTTIKLNADSHLLLVRLHASTPILKGYGSDSSIKQDQPLLKLPHELVRRNFKTGQRYVERERDYIIPALKDTANASLSSMQPPDQTLASLDAMIARMQTLKRKLQVLY